MRMRSWSIFHHYKNWPEIEDYNAGIQNLPREHRPTVRFIQQKKLSQRCKMNQRRQLQRRQQSRLDSYLVQVVKQLQVPCRRHHRHDFFNMSTWLQFPQSKLQLHKLFFRSRQTHPHHYRTPLENFLTAFDESSLIVLCSASRIKQVIALIQQREPGYKQVVLDFDELDFVIFGHGLWESIFELHYNMDVMAIPLSIDSHYFSLVEEEKVYYLDCFLTSQLIQIPSLPTGTFPLSYLFQ